MDSNAFRFGASNSLHLQFRASRHNFTFKYNQRYFNKLFFFFFFALLSASVHLLMLEKSFSTRRYYLMKNVTFLVHIHNPKSTVKCSTGSCVIWRSWEQEKSVVISFFFFFSINFDSYNDWQGHFEMTSLLPKL